MNRVHVITLNTTISDKNVQTQHRLNTVPLWDRIVLTQRHKVVHVRYCVSISPHLYYDVEVVFWGP